MTMIRQDVDECCTLTVEAVASESMRTPALKAALGVDTGRMLMTVATPVTTLVDILSYHRHYDRCQYAVDTVL